MCRMATKFDFQASGDTFLHAYGNQEYLCESSDAGLLDRGEIGPFGKATVIKTGSVIHGLVVDYLIRLGRKPGEYITTS